MDSGTSSDEEEVEHQRLPKYAQTKEFVWLDEKVTSVPRGNKWAKLNRDGRVKELEFYHDWKEEKMKEVVFNAFPPLRGFDSTR